MADLQFRASATRDHHAPEPPDAPELTFVHDGHDVALRLLSDMRSLSRWVIGTFASPPGIFVLAALDSTLFVSLPFGIDAAVIILAARSHTLAWMVPLLATAGSAVGAALTFWMGRAIGDKGLERYVPEKRLARVRDKLKNRGAIALALVCLIPPPFPFTPFVLAAGALEVRPALFFSTLVLMRSIRFGLEAMLAARYGRRILSALESDWFQNIVAGFVVLAAILTILSIIQLARSSRSASQSAAA
jgi:membrane protein YqaA with SNARE-associated domain